MTIEVSPSPEESDDDLAYGDEVLCFFIDNVEE